MTNTVYELSKLEDLDLIAIEREARAMQARALAEMFASLRRGVTGLFARGTATRAA